MIDLWSCLQLGLVWDFNSHLVFQQVPGGQQTRTTTMLDDKPTLLLIGLVVWVSILMGIAIAYAEPSHSTVQRDAPTTRSYAPDGKLIGSASTYGNTRRFYAPDGKLVGTARDRDHP